MRADTRHLALLTLVQFMENNNNYGMGCINMYWYLNYV